jgi:hypothetical protein
VGCGVVGLLGGDLDVLRLQGSAIPISRSATICV